MTSVTTPDVSMDDLAQKLGLHLPALDPAASRGQVASTENSVDGVEPVTFDDEDEEDEQWDEKRDPEKNRMRVSFATSGISKAVLVWGGGLVGVVLLVTFYSGVAGKVGHRAPKVEAQQAEAEETPEDERVANLQQSESQARAQLAMQRQQQQLVEINSQDPKDQSATGARSPAAAGSAATTATANRPTGASARPATAPRPAPAARPVRASRVVDRSPPPRAVPAVVRSAPVPVTRSAPLPAAARASVRPSAAAPVDPQQEWQRLAALGSYGSVAPSPVGVGPSRSAPTPRPATTRPAAPSSVTASLPSQQIPRTTAVATPAVERSTAPPLAQYVRAQAATPAVSVEQSQLRSLPQTPSRRTVLVGSSASAEVVSTIVWSQTQPSSSPRFLIRLSEPLLDRDDQPILPADSLLVVSPRPLADESGLADLEVISVVTGEAEYTPPAGSIVIRGADGDALIAQGQRRGNTFGRDAAVIASSMLSEVGGQLNRPTTQTSTSISTGGGSSTTSSSTTPPPNYLGAALEGGLGTLSDILDERNEAAISEVLSAPEVFQISGGTRVQVFVNRTMTF